MISALNKSFRAAVPALVAAVCLWPWPMRASWGSLRANNHVERQPEPQESHREEQRVVERRRLDIEPERRHAFFWTGFHPGMLIPRLPVGYVQVSAGPNGYFFYNGVFYQFTTGGYAVIAPPLGAIVPQLPEGAEPVSAGPATYYYAGGAFYLPQTLTGFQVVAAPLGITVTDLPPAATAVTLHGTVYYVSGSTYFMPVMQGGVTVYVTAQP